MLRCSSLTPLLMFLRFALGLALALSVTVAQAQSLPDWAAPSEQDATGGPTSVPSAPNSALLPPTVPGTPSPVPLDGGLTLLALAGAGLAARKLRHEA